MPIIPFPSVPDVPGVPALARSVLAPVSQAFTLLTGDSLGDLLGGFSEPQWGIFDADGNLALDADAIIAVEQRKEYRISDYPVEQGSFATYNKVERPREVPVIVTKGGSDSDRQQFIQALEDLASTLDLYSVYTSDWQYESLNLVSHSIRRTARAGVSLLTAELVFEEVRVTASSAFTNTQDPSGGAQANGGTVQPQTPTSGQSAAATGKAT